MDGKRFDGEAFFAAGGALSGVLEGYHPRQAQAALADQVSDTLTRGGVLLAEAGTGTGKTLAYLAPAVASNRKVVVSTATKNLQAQIVDRDVPLLSSALGRPVAAVVLKGRPNYLCLRRLDRFRSGPVFRTQTDAAGFERFLSWAGSTETGDRSDLDGLPDDYAPWHEVCSTSDSCWGSRCPRESDCHYVRHRRAAQKAQVVVVNHHLFFADLVVRTRADAEVLPRYHAVVFDEAHHLETVATHHFGIQVSTYRTNELVRDAAAVLNRMDDPKGLTAPLDATSAAASAFWAALPQHSGTRRLKGPVEGLAATRLREFVDALDRWVEHLVPREAANPELEALTRRSKDLADEVARFGSNPTEDEVRWIEGRGRNVFLRTAPVEVAQHLNLRLFSLEAPLVLTSATLRVGGHFSYLRQRLGIPDGAREAVFPSPFDPPSQGLLYVPRHMPQPNDSAFPDRVVDTTVEVLTASRGRAFCLFTSHRMLQHVAEALSGRVDFPLLVQGQAPREVLLHRFQADTHSVLLGAQSFWEGVDVPGEALSTVIIDRIPFASPGDPLVEARIEAIRRRGDSPFGAYQLPAAAMALRQGVGRLIRHRNDRGVVVLLDRRVVDRSYGRFLLASLPPFPRTRDPLRVEKFFVGGERPDADLPGGP